MSPEYVRSYVKPQKNDDRGSEAVAEASLRRTMRFVPVKSEVQSDLQWLHRVRERLIAEWTALINLPPRGGAGTRDRAAQRRDLHAYLLEHRRVVREHEVGQIPCTGVIV